MKGIGAMALLALALHSAAAETPGATAKQHSSPAAVSESAIQNDSNVETQIQQLREIVLRQAQQIEAQQAMLRGQQQDMDELAAILKREHPAETAPVAPAAYSGNSILFAGAAQQSQPETAQASTPDAVGRMAKDLADTKQALENKIKAIGPFLFTGDFRVRYEPFFGGGLQNAPAPTQRHRERLRLRFNANARLNEEFSGGLSIATGDAADPISTNQTMTGFFTRKPLLVDKAFVQYRPRGFRTLQLTAGKFAYPGYRTELTWDNDLNPEGVSEALVWDWQSLPLQRLGIVAFQLGMNEASAARDSAVFGQQLQTNWKLSERAKLGAYLGFYAYRRADSIAASQIPGGGATGSTGSLGGNALTNFAGLINGSRTFASRFAVLDAIARLDLTTALPRFPLMLQFDFVQNTAACGNLHRFAAAGVSPPACDPRARQGYWSELQFGRTQERGDMRFGYTFIRIERDAVVSAFNGSDLRQATNIANHRLDYLYQWTSNIQTGFTGFFGRQLRTASSPLPERWLKRFQYDLIYKF